MALGFNLEELVRKILPGVKTQRQQYRDKYQKSMGNLHRLRGRLPDEIIDAIMGEAKARRSGPWGAARAGSFLGQVNPQLAQSMIPKPKKEYAPPTTLEGLAVRRAMRGEDTSGVLGLHEKFNPSKEAQRPPKLTGENVAMRALINSEKFKRASQEEKKDMIADSLKHVFPQRSTRPEEPEYANQPPDCLLYTSPSPRDRTRSRMPSSA